MFTYDLRVLKSGRAVYGPTPAFRILCLFFAVVLSSGIVMVLSEEPADPFLLVPAALALVLYFSAFLRDECVFDNNTSTITYKSGWGPFFRTRSVAYGEVSEIRIDHFLKGIPDGSALASKPSWRHPRQVVFYLRLKGEDRRMDLEIAAERKGGVKAERNASLLAGFTGLPMKSDRFGD